MGNLHIELLRSIASYVLTGLNHYELIGRSRVPDSTDQRTFEALVRQALTLVQNYIRALLFLKAG